jgi:TolA-binding protein
VELAKKAGRASSPSARRHLQQVLDEFPTTPSAARARELLEELDAPAKD